MVISNNQSDFTCLSVFENGLLEEKLVVVGLFEADPTFGAEVEVEAAFLTASTAAEPLFPRSSRRLLAVKALDTPCDTELCDFEETAVDASLQLCLSGKR